MTSKDKMEIHTTPVESEDYYDVDTYMYLYKIDDPYHYSWTNDDFIGYHSKIEATLPAGDSCQTEWLCISIYAKTGACERVL